MQKNVLSNNQGQAIVEFVLLLAMILFMSYTILRASNGGIAKLWVTAANIVIHPHDRLRLNDVR